MLGAVREPVTRQRCFSCFRPMPQCLCSHVVRVPNRTHVVVVQHPRERRHPFNTARLLELCLEHSTVYTGHVDALGQSGRAPFELAGAALLYPGPGARPLGSLAPSQRPSRLVVIDGTWHQAHGLYRDVRWLHELPQLSFDVVAQSGFAIRKQPAVHCLSTLEAVHLSLSQLEPDTPRLDALLELFRAMVEQQLRVRAHAGRTRKDKRSRGDLPRALYEDFERLVVVYAETARCEESSRALLAVSALRMRDGERFDFVFRRQGVAAGHLAHMGMVPSDLERGRSPSEFAAAWTAFIDRDDIVGVWSDTTLSALGAEGAVPGRSLVLKASYRRWRAAKGGMDDIAAREGLPRLQGPGPRRHQRLANAVAIARLLHTGPRAPAAQRKNERPTVAAG